MQSLWVRQLQHTNTKPSTCTHTDSYFMRILRAMARSSPSRSCKTNSHEGRCRIRESVPTIQVHTQTHTCLLFSCCWIFTWAAFLSALAAGRENPQEIEGTKKQNHWSDFASFVIWITWQNVMWKTFSRLGRLRCFLTCAQTVNTLLSAKLYSHCLLSAFCIRSFRRSCGVILGCRWHNCVSTSFHSPTKVCVL